MNKRDMLDAFLACGLRLRLSSGIVSEWYYKGLERGV